MDLKEYIYLPNKYYNNYIEYINMIMSYFALKKIKLLCINILK